MVVAALSGFVLAVWMILCAVAYASSDRQVLGGVVFESEVNAAFVLVTALGSGLGLLAALLGLSGLRVGRLGRTRWVWAVTSLASLAWAFASVVDGGATFLTVYLLLATGLAAGVVALAPTSWYEDVAPATER
ncbi:hypothetical protein [Aeromicrobium sp. HA]|uniref:hypothetical protein n=1 Tax=Aeromicrobium sp. HA TaxID=3009077 RepID=UPI0022AEABEF|nr:hypothetical protein [Aeromicrobium sp. HA]